MPTTAVHWSSLFVDQAHVWAQNEPRFAPGEGQGAHVAEGVGALQPRGNTIRAVTPTRVHPFKRLVGSPLSVTCHAFAIP